MAQTRLTRLIASFAMLATTTAPLSAGGRAVDCYEHFSKPPVYGTVTENVQVHPGYTHVEATPPIIGTATREILVAPQRIVQKRIAAQYQYIEERVLLEPARTVKRRAPAVVETRYKKVRVDGGYGWEWRVIKGKRVLCKVKYGPRFKKVPYSVEVSPARWVHETVPARYGVKTRKVMVHPESTESYVLAPEYKTVTEQVVIQPKVVRHHRVAPSYRTRTRDVVVEPGREGWKRVPLHCR